MLAQNMLRSIIILFEIELPRRKFRFILFPLGINLLMSSLSHFLLLPLLLFVSSFRLILHPQLEGAYYRIYLYRKYCIGNIVYIILCGNLHHCCPTHTHTHTHTLPTVVGWLSPPYKYSFIRR
jgi:hypothetical protein